MFGGAGIYSQGTMFGLLHGGRVYLKMNEDTRREFVERSAEPFRPRRGPVIKSYYELPADVADDDEALLARAERVDRDGSIGYNSPHYFCFIAPHAHHVRLGFEHGHRSSDPKGLAGEERGADARAHDAQESDARLTPAGHRR